MAQDRQEDGNEQSSAFTTDEEAVTTRSVKEVKTGSN